MMDQKEAAHAVLVEVVNILGVFKNDFVVVGGWVPDLKYPGRNHVGSLDVDLAVGPGAVGADAYSTILGRLKEHHYSHESGPTRFYRTVPGASEPVKVDLVSGEYADNGKTAAIQVDELRLSALHGTPKCRKNLIRSSLFCLDLPRFKKQRPSKDLYFDPGGGQRPAYLFVTVNPCRFIASCPAYLRCPGLPHQRPENGKARTFTQDEPGF